MFWGKQRPKLTVQKKCSYTSCFWYSSLPPPLFWHLGCHPHPNKQEKQQPRINVKSGDSKILNPFLPRRARCSRVSHPWPTDSWKRLKTGKKDQHTILYSLNIQRYNEFQKVNIVEAKTPTKQTVSGVKYFELGFPNLHLIYMLTMFTCGFHTIAQSDALGQSTVIPVYTPYEAHTQKKLSSPFEAP